MTDRELLEAAAMAAGYEVRWHEVWECFVHEGAVNITNPPSMAGQRMVWVPLDDDGDALRLAVKLGVCIERDFDRIDVYRERGLVATEFLYERPAPTDVYAATRRAIVRAAAELS